MNLIDRFKIWLSYRYVKKLLSYDTNDLLVSDVILALEKLKKSEGKNYGKFYDPSDYIF